MSTVTSIESLQQEDRGFPPPAEFSEKAYVKSMAELDRLRKEAKNSS